MEHQHEADGDGGMKSRANIALAVFLIIGAVGAYARIRHPQYAGFVLIMAGFLFQWPTLVTLVMFPILVVMYVLLARREEPDAIAEFGEEYARYASKTPAFLPRFSSSAGEKATT